MTTSDDGRPVDAEPDETAPDDTVTDETVSDETELVARRRGPVPPTLVLVAVVLALLAGVLVTRATGTWGPHDARAQTPPAQTRPVTSALLVCAAVPPGSDHTQTIVAAGAPTAGTGTLTLTQLAGRAPIATAPPGGNVLRYLTPVGRGGPMVVRATGDLARGLTASVTTRTSLGGARSLATQQCTQPAGHTWFVGGGATQGRRSLLYLTDADTADALVDVTVYTSKGPQQPTSSQGVTVPAGKQKVLALDALVPGAVATAVEVRTRSGRVAAALLDSKVSGLQPGGVEWVPPSAPPGNELVVTGVPGDPGDRRVLSLLVPGTDDAQVRVRLSTSQGTLSPQQLGERVVPGGQLQTFDLGKAGVTGPYAVLVDSDHPVVAGVLTTRAPAGQLPDFTYGASAAPVVGGAVVLPRVARSVGTSTQLQLTNPGSDDLVVRLTTLVTGGTAPAPQSVTVPAGQTLTVPVGVTGPAPTALLVETTTRTDLVVGWVLAEQGSRGALLTGGPLPQTPLTTSVPGVAPDPATGYPGH
jgi:hypothetical protein